MISKTATGQQRPPVTLLEHGIGCFHYTDASRTLAMLIR